MKESFERRIERALGPFGCSHANPCGGTGYYDRGLAKPFRVLFNDGAPCESYRTAEEAIAAAEQYAEEMKYEMANAE